LILSHTFEQRILASWLTSRGSYDETRVQLDDSELSATAQVVARLLGEYYSIDGNAPSCRPEVIVDRFRNKEGNPKLVKTLESYVGGLDLAVSVPNVRADIRQLRRSRVGAKLAGLLANGDSGAETDNLIVQYQTLGDENVEDNQDVFMGVEVGSLVSENILGGTTPFGLRGLDEATDGGARPGHHILVFARPEVGKTLFTLNLVSSFLQRNLVVLYVGNEDPMGDIVLRLVGCLTGLTKREIYRDPATANERAFGRGYGGFVGFPRSPGRYKDIELAVDKYSPSVVVLDQLRNIDVGDDNRVTALEKAAIGARNLAKSRGVVVVSITQAGDSAEGKSTLDLSDIDFSKTGIPGAIDLAIGIGATQEDKQTGYRTISLPKNKLGGKHTSYQVHFDTTTGLVREL
jgi:AAA domain